MTSDIWFKHPFTSIIGGPTGSGKYILYTIPREPRYLCTEPDFTGGIIWCYSEQSAVPHHQLIALKKNVQIREGLPENFENTKGLPCLFILDELLITRCVTCSPRAVIIATSVLFGLPKTFFTKRLIAATYR
jgi:hypothetical protein